MGRTRMVSRTVKGTEAQVLMINVISAETNVQIITLGSTYKDDKALLKAVQKSYDTDELKAVRIVSSIPIETRYGMTEDQFIKNAEVLQPLVKKQ